MGWLRRAFGGSARTPRDVDALLRSALLAVLAGDEARAEDCLKRALRLDSTSAEPYLALARLLRRRGEVGRAIRIHQNLLLRADLRDDQRLEALLDLGADFREAGFVKRAVATYEEVVDREPRNATALRALAELLTESGEHARALDAARRAARAERVDGRTEQAALLVAMAEAARAEGRNDDALRTVKRALRKDKESVAAWCLLAALEAERGRSKAALAAWSRVPRLDRRSGPRVYAELEASFAATGQAREYETYLRELLTEQSDDPDARVALARTLAARGDVDAALAELRALVGADPDDVAAHAELTGLLLSAGRGGDAAQAHAELARALARRGLLRRGEGA